MTGESPGRHASTEEASLPPGVVAAGGCSVQLRGRRTPEVNPSGAGAGVGRAQKWIKGLPGRDYGMFRGTEN